MSRKKKLQKTEKPAVTKEPAADIQKYINYGAWATITLISLIYIFRTNDFLFFQGGDDAYYILLGKAIVAGQGYRDTFVVGSPAHIHFPPLFPLLLAAIIAIKGTDLLLMKGIVSLAAAASLILMYLLAKRRSFAWAFVAPIWLGICHRFFTYNDFLLTESLFMTFAILCMLAFEKWLRDGDIKFAVLAVLACWASILTRSAGVTLPPAIAAAIILKKGINRKAVIEATVAFLALLAPLIAWSMRNSSVSVSAVSYTSQFFAVDPYDLTKGNIGLLGLFERFFKSFGYYYIDTLGIIWPADEIPSNPLTWFLAAIFWGLFGLGLVNKLRKDPSITETFTIAFIGLALVWPFLDYRFLIPVYPFVLLYIVEGAYYLTSIIPLNKLELKKALVTTFAIIICLDLAVNVKALFKYQDFIRIISLRKIPIEPGLSAASGIPVCERLLKASVWLAKNGEKNSVVMVRKPSLVGLTGVMPVIGVPSPPPDYPEKWLKDNNVKYIIVDEWIPDVARFVMAMPKDKMEVINKNIIYSDNRTVVVKVTPEFFAP